MESSPASKYQNEELFDEDLDTILMLFGRIKIKAEKDLKGAATDWVKSGPSDKLKDALKVFMGVSYSEVNKH